MNNHVVFTVGRFNPPTVGHGKLFSVVKEKAGILGTDYRLFTTKTQGTEKSPLALDEKMDFLNAYFGETINPTVNVFTAARELASQGYEVGTLIVGSDHGLELVEQMRNYIGHKDPKHDLGLKAIYGITVDREELDVSSTKLREYASLGDFLNFTKFVPSSDSALNYRLYQAVRRGLGIDEHEH